MRICQWLLALSDTSFAFIVFGRIWVQVGPNNRNRAAPLAHGAYYGILRQIELGESRMKDNYISEHQLLTLTSIVLNFPVKSKSNGLASTT